MRPTQAIIDLQKLRDNFSAITAAAPGAQVLWVVKANAYGHGLVRVAQELETLGAKYLGVALLEEGVTLRKAGITTPILVFGGLSYDQIEDYLTYDLTLTIPSVTKLERLIDVVKATGKSAKIHLKINTGLSRIGVRFDRVSSLINALQSAPQQITVEGMYQQFADSDGDLEFTNLQFERFVWAVNQLRTAGIHPPLVHVCNSPALAKYPHMHLTMVRAGRLLYGISHPSWNKTIPVSPVLSWKTEVCYFKIVEPGDTVGYMRTWTATRRDRIVTLPLGYADGYPRAASNKSSVLIAGKKYPVVGLIAMDQMMVNLGVDGEAYCGDEVVLLGKQGDQEITIHELASAADTIPHEIITRISDRVPRVYLE